MAAEPTGGSFTIDLGDGTARTFPFNATEAELHAFIEQALIDKISADPAFIAAMREDEERLLYGDRRPGRPAFAPVGLIRTLPSIFGVQAQNRHTPTRGKNRREKRRRRKAKRG